MKIAIANMSDIVAENRWDVDFHFLNTEFKDRAAALEARYPRREDGSPPAEVSAALAVFDNDIKGEILHPLSRWQSRRYPRKRSGMDGIAAIEKEYPYLSLAILNDIALREADKIDARIEELRARAIAMRGVAQGFAKPVEDPQAAEAEVPDGVPSSRGGMRP